jgi:DNA/RNA-binding domain of Phe-tRNA-synthetase-like protein
MTLPIVVEPLPGFAPVVLAAELPVALGELPTPGAVAALLQPGAAAPMATSEVVRTAVRDVLRQRGYRPTGRGKPSSEYLVAAVAEGRLGAINAVVDIGNAVSLHSGLPISVVDRDRLVGTPRIAVPAMGTSYVFNASGQEIDVGGLPCLVDDLGPCANAVKDAQRTKTTPATRRVLVVVWGCTQPDSGRPLATARWLESCLQGTQSQVAIVDTQSG